MGLLDPTEDDKSYEKKPRFSVDLAGYAIMFLAGIGMLIYVVFFA